MKPEEMPTDMQAPAQTPQPSIHWPSIVQEERGVMSDALAQIEETALHREGGLLPKILKKD